MQKVIADPRMQFRDRPSVFDGTRLIVGGFVSMLIDCRIECIEAHAD